MTTPPTDKITGCVAQIETNDKTRDCGKAAQPHRIFKPVYVPAIMLCDEHVGSCLCHPKEAA